MKHLYKNYLISYLKCFSKVIVFEIANTYHE